MTTADQLAIVNKLLHPPEEAHTLVQVSLAAVLSGPHSPPTAGRTGDRLGQVPETVGAGEAGAGAVAVRVDLREVPVDWCGRAEC